MHQNNVYNIEQIVKNLINRSKTVKKKKNTMIPFIAI